VIARSVLRPTFFTALKLPAMALLAVAAAGACMGVLTRDPPPPAQAKAPAFEAGRINSAEMPGERPGDAHQFIERLDWTLSAVSPDQRSIALQAGKGRSDRKTISLVPFRDLLMPSGLYLDGLRVAPDARVTVDGQPAGLNRLREGMRVNVELSADHLAVVGIRAASENPDSLFVQVLERVDAAGRAVSFTVPGTAHALERVPVADGARITWFRSRPEEAVRVGALEFKDLREGMPVSIGLEIGEDGRLSIRSLIVAR
jgi:hypothetical protein